MKKLFVSAVVSMMLLAGCSSTVNSFQKMGKGMSASDYVIILYSGGEVMNWWYIEDKIVNSEDGSDGWYWIQNDRLRRVSGDTVIEEVKGISLEEIKKIYGLEDKYEK